MGNEQQIVIAMFGLIFTGAMLFATFYLIVIMVKYWLRRRNTKIALKLLNIGYTPLSFDSNGVPYLIKKGGHIETVSNIYKSEKKGSLQQ